MAHASSIGRCIDLFTDFGFKRIFDTERNKDLLTDFLNNLLANELPSVKALNYRDKEKSGKHYSSDCPKSD
ncbi:PD-(D/E)XK nuclease family transposase [Eisenibacter elegans]|uniref:PD-(D/E)XK nuclease family transposase n=1 Tax=Eisenibacter elegans TaxID=997 RepID=UPI0004281823|nr:PD-(D/E)XK nuclease family transposase [Eisenibacter elegans]